MAKWMIGLAVAVVLTGARMATHPAAPATPQARADLLATALNATAPKPLGAHATLTGAKADGNAIEVEIRLAADAPLDMPTDVFRKMFAAASCKQSSIAEFIGRGGVVRYAMTTAEGRGLDPVTIDACPAS